MINRTSNKERPSIGTVGLVEQLVERPNMLKAYHQVLANKGAPGVDEITCDELKDQLKEQWESIKSQLLKGEYTPQPVKRVEIPKPSGKGTRTLGIPTVMDRLIQQALVQILTPIFEPTFSKHSYGFRPKRNAHQAVRAAQGYIREGKRWVVDMDLEKFFDRVNHDILMQRVGRRINDPRILRLIRSFLKAGVRIDKKTIPNREGTPQGGPLSPILSNILLTDLDRQLERRGHKFVRYADDCNIYVASEKAGNRVLSSMTKWIEKNLKLQVNQDKSAVGRPWQRRFLGFSFTSQIKTRVRVHQDSVSKLREKLKRLFRIARGCSTLSFINETLNPVLRGWIAYFRHADTRQHLRDLDIWILRRLRLSKWRQWSRAIARYKKLGELGILPNQAYMTAYSSRKPWRVSGFKVVREAMPWSYFGSRGLVSLSDSAYRLV